MKPACLFALLLGVQGMGLTVKSSIYRLDEMLFYEYAALRISRFYFLLHRLAVGFCISCLPVVGVHIGLPKLGWNNDQVQGA